MKKIEEKRTVKVIFFDDMDAKAFEDKVKSMYNIPTNIPKYRVVSGKSESGKSVFIESALSNKVINEMRERLNKKKS